MTNPLIDTLKTWFLEGVSEGIKIIFLLLIAILIENKFGIIQKLNRILHKIINSKTQFILNFSFNSKIDFIDVKKNLKNFFREKYGVLKIYKDTSQTMELLVDNSFVIILSKNPRNEIIIRTNKIKTGMWNVNKEINKFINIIDDLEELMRIKKQGIFNEKETSIYLFLPYKNKITKIYPPRNIKVKDFCLELAHKDYVCVIKLKLDVLELHSKKSKDLEKIINKLI